MPLGIQPDPTPGVGINISPEQFASDAAEVAGTSVLSSLLPFGELALSVGLPLLIKIFEDEPEIPYPEVGFSFKAQSPERHVFGESLVEPDIRWAGVRPVKFTTANRPHNDILTGDARVLDLLIYVSSGKCDSIEALKIGETVYTLKNANSNSVKAPTGNLGSKGQFYVREFFQSNSAPQELIDAYGGALGGNDKDPNRSFIQLSLITRDNHIFWSGFDPQSIGLIVKGDHVYDLSNLSGSKRWTPNRVSILYTVMRDMAGYAASAFDEYFWKRAYNLARVKIGNDGAYYDQVTGSKLTGGNRGAEYAKRYPGQSLTYAANGVIYYSDNYDDILFGLLECMFGGLYDYGGKIRLIVGENKTFDSNTFRLDETKMEEGSFETQTGKDIYDSINEIEYGYLSQPDAFSEVRHQFTDTAAVTRDGKTVTKKINALPFVTDGFQAQRYIRNKLTEVRNYVTWKANWLNLTGVEKAKLLPGEPVYLDYSPLDLTNQETLVHKVRHDKLRTTVILKSKVVYSNDYDLAPLAPAVEDTRSPEQVSKFSYDIKTDDQAFVDNVSANLQWYVDDITAYTIVELGDKPSSGATVYDRSFTAPSNDNNDEPVKLNIPSLVYDKLYNVRTQTVAFNGQRSGWSTAQEIDTAKDTTPPAAPNNISATGVSNGFILTTEEVVRQPVTPARTGTVVIRDYLHTEVTISQTSQSDIVKTFTGNSFEYIDTTNYVDPTSLSLSVRYVDASNNKSAASTATVTTTEAIGAGDLILPSFGERAVYSLYLYLAVHRLTASGSWKMSASSSATAAGILSWSDASTVRYVHLNRYDKDGNDAYTDKMELLENGQQLVIYKDDDDWALFYCNGSVTTTTIYYGVGNNQSYEVITIPVRYQDRVGLTGNLPAQHGSDANAFEIRLGLGGGVDGISYQELTIYRAVNIGSDAPDTPTGGSWVWSSSTLTAPSQWGATFPSDYDPSTQEVYASITHGNSENELGAWSAPQPDAALGDIDMIWKRAATKPDKPQNSTTQVPSTWHANEPSGTDPLWALVQKRPARSATWHRGNVFRPEGVDGKSNPLGWTRTYNYNKLRTGTQGLDGKGSWKISTGGSLSDTGISTYTSIKNANYLYLDHEDSQTTEVWSDGLSKLQKYDSIVLYKDDTTFFNFRVHATRSITTTEVSNAITRIRIPVVFYSEQLPGGVADTITASTSFDMRFGIAISGDDGAGEEIWHAKSSIDDASVLTDNFRTLADGTSLNQSHYDRPPGTITKTVTTGGKSVSVDIEWKDLKDEVKVTDDEPHYISMSRKVPGIPLDNTDPYTDNTHSTLKPGWGTFGDVSVIAGKGVDGAPATPSFTDSYGYTNLDRSLLKPSQGECKATATSSVTTVGNLVTNLTNYPYFHIAAPTTLDTGVTATGWVENLFDKLEGKEIPMTIYANADKWGTFVATSPTLASDKSYLTVTAKTGTMSSYTGPDETDGLGANEAFTLRLGLPPDDGVPGLPGFTDRYQYDTILTGTNNFSSSPDGEYKITTGSSVTSSGKNNYGDLEAITSGYLWLGPPKNVTGALPVAGFYQKMQNTLTVGSSVLLWIGTQEWTSYRITSAPSSVSNRLRIPIAFIGKLLRGQSSIGASDNMYLGVNQAPEEPAPGAPGFNVQFEYEDMITGATAVPTWPAKGDMKLTITSTVTATGYRTLASLASCKYLWINASKDVTSSTDGITYLADLLARTSVGTIITLWVSKDKWLSYRITQGASLQNNVLRYGIDIVSAHYTLGVASNQIETTDKVWLSINETASEAGASGATPVQVSILTLGVTTTQTTASIDWADDKRTSYYVVEYEKGNLSALTSNKSSITVNSSFIKIPDLDKNSTYTYNIYGRNGPRTGPSMSPLQKFTTKNTPGRPQRPLISNLTNTTATVTAQAVPNAVTYEAQVSTSSSFSGATTEDMTNLVLEKTGLTPSTKYYARVQVKGDDGVASGWGPSQTFTTLSNTPVVAISSITKISATATWTLLTGYDNYKVEVQAKTSGTTWGTNPTLVFNQEGATLTTTSITGLTKNTRYIYRVGARKNNVYTWSTVGAFTTLDDPKPYTPYIDPNFITKTGARISWFRTESYNQYRVQGQESASGTTWDTTKTNAFQSNVTGLVYNASNLKIGVRYLVRVGYRPTGESTYKYSDPAAFTTLNEVPDQPSVSYGYKNRGGVDHGAYPEEKYNLTFNKASTGGTPTKYRYKFWKGFTKDEPSTWTNLPSSSISNGNGTLAVQHFGSDCVTSALNSNKGTWFIYVQAGNSQGWSSTWKPVGDGYNYRMSEPDVTESPTATPDPPYTSYYPIGTNVTWTWPAVDGATRYKISLTVNNGLTSTVYNTTRSYSLQYNTATRIYMLIQGNYQYQGTEYDVLASSWGTNRRWTNNP